MILSSKLLLLLYLASRCRVSISQMSCAGALLLRGPTATLCMSVCLWVSVCVVSARHKGNSVRMTNIGNETGSCLLLIKNKKTSPAKYI